MSVKDKKAMLAFSTGASQTMFQPDGINGDINVTLWPLQVCGMNNLKCVNDNMHNNKVFFLSFFLISCRMALSTSVDFRFLLHRYFGAPPSALHRCVLQCWMDGKPDLEDCLLRGL